MKTLPNISCVRECRDCGTRVCFSDEVISPGGKRIPLDPSTLTHHRCKAKPVTVFTRRCRNCGAKVSFSDAVLNDNGRRVPLDHITLTPHYCEVDEDQQILNAMNCVAAINRKLKTTQLRLVREPVDQTVIIRDSKGQNQAVAIRDTTNPANCVECGITMTNEATLALHQKSHRSEIE